MEKFGDILNKIGSVCEYEKNADEIQIKTISEGKQIRTISEETRLINFISENAKDIELTLAERILLGEGSILGIADCSIPPYVEYENMEVMDMNPNVIRTDILQWALGSQVSKILFKTGALEIIGARIIQSNLKIGQLLKDNNKSNRKLDLSSKDITIDLQFENCIFDTDIDLNNSNFENFILKNCFFIHYKSGYNITARNSVVNGNFIIENEGISMFKDSNFLKLNSIDLTNFQINGYLNITSTGSGIIEINEICAKHAQVNGNLFIESFGEQNIRINYLDLYNTHLQLIILQNINIQHNISLSLAHLDNLFFVSCIIGEINAGGISVRGVQIKNSIVWNGAFFHKSVINNFFECPDSVFIYCSESDVNGICLSLNSSNIGSVSLNEGFVSYGKIIMNSTKIEGSLNLESSILITSPDNNNIALNASHLNVRKIEFNPVKGQSVDYNWIVDDDKSSVDDYIEKEFDKNKPKRYKKIDQLNYYRSELIRKLHEINDSPLENLKSLIEKRIDQLETIKLLIEDNIGLMQKMNVNSYVKGEVNFEYAIVDGCIDFAGGFFTIDENNQTQYKKKDNIPNAINLQFAEIKGALYLNNGYNNGMPFSIGVGDIDLKSASINNFFISITKEFPKKDKVRFRMIGTKYNYINNSGENKENKGRKRFYNADWIFNEKELKIHRNINKGYGNCNFRQPYEQFASTLFKAGEDGKARDVLINHRPAANWLEKFIMYFVKGIYNFSSRLERCIISLIILLFVSAWIFQLPFGSINFNFKDSLLFSLEKLIPIIKISDLDLKFEDWRSYYIIAHSFLGIIFISMFLVNIARLRKGDN